MLDTTASKMNEKELIASLQQQISLCEDMDAYRQLYDLLHQRLFRFSYSLVRFREPAEEIVSDVFVKLWRIRQELAGIQNLTVYLYTITKNLSLNHISRAYKYPKISLDQMSVETISGFGNPEESFISSELAKRINRAIDDLPSQCKIIFQLVRENGLQQKEAAAVLNLSEFTVRNQLTIATRKVAEALQLKIPQPRLKRENKSF